MANKIIIPTPSIDEVEKYLKKWDSLENYVLQENSLNKLFYELVPNNKCMEDILIKASTLNDFYSTNIFLICPFLLENEYCSVKIKYRNAPPVITDHLIP